jgi:long-subunit fatty acid transport protein
MKKIKKLIILFLFLLPSFVQAESSVFALVQNSLGEHHYPYSVAALGRGGFSMAFIDTVNLNQMNYALWTYLPKTTFSLNFGYQGLQSQSATNEISSIDGNFYGGFLVMPLMEKVAALGFGVLPKSINNQGFLVKNVGVGAQADQTLKVQGTLSEVQIAGSFAIGQNLSIGLFLYYILGKINDRTQVTYTEAGYSDIDIENIYQFYGKAPSGGISAFLRVTPRLSVGARLKLPTVMTMYTQQSSRSSEKDIEKYQDITFPLNITLGATWEPFERWVIGGDVDYINWESGYKFNGITVSGMNNNFRIGAGIEHTPSKRRLAPYSSKMNYRAGVFYGQLNFMANSNTVEEYGASLGLGLPIRSGSSRIDLAIQAGQRGDITLNGLSEKFFRLNFSVSANELWFSPENR